MKPNIESRARWAFAILVFLGIAAGLIWYVMDAGRYATYQVRTRDAVSGLIVDAPVEFHGVEVGRVKKIDLTSPNSVSILLSIKKGTPVTLATVATITARGLASRGFIGYVYVSLEDTGTNPQPLAPLPNEPFPVIAAAPSRSVNLDTAISQVNANVQLMTELMQAALDKNTLASLKQSVDNLQQVTQTLAANNQKLSAIVSNTERASNQFKPLLESSNNTVRALQTQILPEAHKTLNDLDNVSNSMSGIAAKLNRDPSLVVRGRAPLPLGPGETK